MEKVKERDNEKEGRRFVFSFFLFSWLFQFCYITTDKKRDGTSESEKEKEERGRRQRKSIFLLSVFSPLYSFLSLFTFLSLFYFYISLFSIIFLFLSLSVSVRKCVQLEKQVHSLKSFLSRLVQIDPSLIQRPVWIIHFCPTLRREMVSPTRRRPSTGKGALLLCSSQRDRQRHSQSDKTLLPLSSVSANSSSSRSERFKEVKTLQKYEH